MRYGLRGWVLSRTGGRAAMSLTWIGKREGGRGRRGAWIQRRG